MTEYSIDQIRRLPLPERLKKINELQKLAENEQRMCSEAALRAQVHTDLLVQSLLYFCATMSPQNFASSVYSAAESIRGKVGEQEHLVQYLETSKAELLAFAEKLFLIQQQRKSQVNAQGKENDQ